MIKRNLWWVSFKSIDNHTEELNSESRIYKIAFIGYISLIVIVLMSGCLNKENKPPNSVLEGNSNVTPSPTPLAAWIDDGGQKRDVKANVSTVDGVGVVLRERAVPIDRPAYEETLYVAFKSEDLPGYNIFTITPGFQSPASPQKIEVDYIGLKKDGNKTFLELVYKTNKAFDFEIGKGYSKDADFTDIYPVTSSLFATKLFASARETNDWQTASLEINPAISEEFARLDIAIGYLEELDRSWRYGDKKFVWDERRISADSAGKIGEDMKSGFGTPKIRMLSYGSVLIELSFSPPVLQKKIIVVSGNETRKEGTIAISY